MICFRIYVVHDEVKDKNFELELSWVGESKYKFVKLALRTKPISENTIPDQV